MTEEVFVSLIKKEFNWLIQKEFEIKQIERLITFEKIYQNKVYAIEFSWSEYHVIAISGFGAYKRFNEVEKVIANTLKEKLDFTIRKPWKGEVPKEFHTYANDNLLTGSIYISNADQVKKFSDLVKIFFKNEATPFFEQFSSINDVVSWLKNNPIEEHSNLLVLNQNAMMLRKLILLKEANSNDYEDLYMKYRAFLQKKNREKESPYVKMYEKFIKFDEYFSS